MRNLTEEAVNLDVLEICAKMIRDAVGTMSTKFSAHVKDEINTKVSSLYKPGGTATLATLPALTADNAGYVYDMSEAFMTTASFREGAGHKYPAGTNVVVSDVGNGVYKYDVLSGMLDGYVQESRKVGGVPLSADIPVTLTGDTAITVTNTGTASGIGYSVAHNDSGVTAGSKGDSTNQTPGFGETFKTLSETVDAKGHVTSLAEHTVKTPDKEATQSAKGLMSAADKTKLDTLIDDTLSNSDKAADAKATGDKIAALESENALLRELVNGIDAPIYREASGNPATFDDAYPANVKALSVEITPTQSGSGDPYPPGRGKNLLSINTAGKTENGVTFTVIRDSANNATGVSVNGTATAMTFCTVNSVRLPAGDYILSSGGVGSMDKENGVDKFHVFYAVFGGKYYWCRENNQWEVAFTLNSELTLIFAIRIDADVTANNLVFRPMLRLASNTDPTFAPYSNVRPITGPTSVSVTRTGENGANAQSVTVSLVDSNNDPLTVYGGTLNVTTGELTVTWANIASYNGETLPGRWISDRDVYASDATPTTGAQVVYELATPVTYQLTPQQLATLSGYNNVTADAGTLSVTYRADPALSLGGGV